MKTADKNHNNKHILDCKISKHGISYHLKLQYPQIHQKCSSITINQEEEP